MKSIVKSLIVAVVVLGMILGSIGIASAITNGQPDGDGHTYVGLAVFDAVYPDGTVGPAWRCSCSLLSPTIVLTAGHCTAGAVAARVWFDEIVEGNPNYPFSDETSYDGVPQTNPDFCMGCGNGLPEFDFRDVGVIELTEPVPSAVVDKYVELPAAGLVDTLQNKTDLTIVGYGVQEQHHGGGPPFWTGLKLRLVAPSELFAANFVHSDEFIKITLNSARGTGGVCFGDSGGPELLEDTDTVLAVTSYGNRNCTGVGYSSRIDIPEVLQWIGGFL